MRALLPLFLAFYCGLLQAQSGGLVVVVNAQNPVETITAKQVADLYLGRSRAFPNSHNATPIDLLRDSPVRARFYFDLTGKPIADINAYWARLLFSGQSTPPREAGDAAAVIEAVRKNASAIGYLEREPADKGVKVILTIPGR